MNNIRVFGIIKVIKYAWQRAVRGYDDTFMWGMDEYLEYYFIPAIKEFCETKSKDIYDKRYKTVYKETLKRIEEWEKGNADNGFKIWSYFGKNIGYFWD